MPGRHRDLEAYRHGLARGRCRGPPRGSPGPIDGGRRATAGRLWNRRRRSGRRHRQGRRSLHGRSGRRDLGPGSERRQGILGQARRDRHVLRGPTRRGTGPFLRTGDLGAMDEKGELFVVGPHQGSHHRPRPKPLPAGHRVDTFETLGRDCARAARSRSRSRARRARETVWLS